MHALPKHTPRSRTQHAAITTSVVANLVVLPAPGQAAYWLEPGRFEQTFLGQHGGLTANELEIPLVSWIAGG